MSSVKDNPCPVLVLDGGLGTTLESPPYNVKFSSSTPLWSSHLLLSSPETLLDVQREFFRAGADILLTATYQASLDGFAATSKLLYGAKDHKMDSRGILNASGNDDHKEAEDLMRSAVTISRTAFSPFPSQSSRQKLVALSLGAYGACMQPSQEYTGDYKPEIMTTRPGLAKWHADRLRIFRGSSTTWDGIDLVAFETVPLRNEILAARAAMGGLNTELSEKHWWISCVFPNDDMRLPDGSMVMEVVEAMLGSDIKSSPRPWGIGINCTKVRRLEALVLEYERAAREILHECEKRPWLVIYPDGTDGLVYNTSKQVWEMQEETNGRSKKAWDEEVFEIVKRTRERGFWEGIVVGGCCKTSPEDIAHLRKRIDKM